MHGPMFTSDSLALLILPVLSMLGGPPGGPGDGADDDSQLGWLRALGDSEALAQIMERDKQLTQGLEAAEALAELGDVRGLDHLISALNSPSTYLRHQAAQILKRLNHPRGLRALKEHPEDPAASSRSARREQLHADLDARDTDELVAMWHEHDRSEWSERAFEAMESILTERLGKLPVREADEDDGGSEAIDENADPRIQELWLDGDIEGLTDILEGDPDVRLRLEAAEALAYLGDEAALDVLAAALDDPDEKYSQLAAELLDWLDLPRGNAALEDRGYEFETGAEDMLGASGTRPPSAASNPRAPAVPQDSWVAAPPASSTSRFPRAQEPQRVASQPVWQPDQAAPALPLVVLTGASGGLLGFILFGLGLQILGELMLPANLAGWLQPPMLYYLAVAVGAGAAFGNLGSRIARLVAARLGWETGEGDLLPVLGAFLEGATSALIADLLLFMLLVP